MAGLVPAIHDLVRRKTWNGRDKHGHDAKETHRPFATRLSRMISQIGTTTAAPSAR
jgi:hypothetical protein